MSHVSHPTPRIPLSRPALRGLAARRFMGLVLLIPIFFSGCVHSRAPLRTATVPEGAPGVRDVLAELNRQQQALVCFRATGRLVVKLPGDAAAYSFRGTRLLYAAPDRFYVEARKHGARAFLLTAAGEEYVVVSPTRRAYLHDTEARLPSGAGEYVSPADLAREMLLGGDWAHLSPRRMEITGFDRITGEVTVEVYQSAKHKQLLRRLHLRGGPSWRAVLEQRFDPDTGRVVAETSRENYGVMAGVLFPEHLETRFPGQDAWMRLDVRRLETEVFFGPEVFDVESALRDARRRGYKRMETVE